MGVNDIQDALPQDDTDLQLSQVYDQSPQSPCFLPAVCGVAGGFLCLAHGALGAALLRLRRVDGLGAHAGQPTNPG